MIQNFLSAFITRLIFRNKLFFLLQILVHSRRPEHMVADKKRKSGQSEKGAKKPENGEPAAIPVGLMLKEHVRLFDQWLTLSSNCFYMPIKLFGIQYFLPSGVFCCLDHAVILRTFILTEHKTIDRYFETTLGTQVWLLDFFGLHIYFLGLIFIPFLDRKSWLPFGAGSRSTSPQRKECDGLSMPQSSVVVFHSSVSALRPYAERGSLTSGQKVLLLRPWMVNFGAQYGMRGYIDPVATSKFITVMKSF